MLKAHRSHVVLHDKADADLCIAWPLWVRSVQPVTDELPLQPLFLILVGHRLRLR